MSDLLQRLPVPVIAALALLLLLGAVALVVLLRRRRPAAKRPAAIRAPRYPVVLAHGLLGFDQIKLAGSRAEYFKGIPARLRRMGAEVVPLKVPALGSIAERAEALAHAVRQIDAKRVNIIAHSMGGLDARYAISRLGLSDKVASLTTIGTPHQGTPLADVGTGLFGDMLGLKRVVEAVGLNADAFYDLTTVRLTKFNKEVPDASGVHYASLVAAVKSKLKMNPLLLAPHLFLNEKSGENDGIVPTGSQTWGEIIARIDADHWAQIGWGGRGFDAAALYAEVLRELRARGL